MSKRFLGDTKLCGYEAMMQEPPDAGHFNNDIRKRQNNYQQMLECLLDELNYSALLPRIKVGIRSMLFDEFVFKNLHHKTAFYTACRQYAEKDNITKKTLAIIYLLTVSVLLKEILDKYITDKRHVFANKVGGIGEEAYNLYQMAKKISGVDSKVFDEDLKEPNIITDTILSLFINALFLQRFGLKGLTQDVKKKKIIDYCYTGRQHSRYHTYSYKDQTIKIKM